jgi:plastocyanin
MVNPHHSPLTYSPLTNAKEMIMKCVYFLFPIVCPMALAGLLAWPAGEKTGEKQAAAKTITVTMKSLSYDPKKLEIGVGDSVVWSNKAFAAHTATSDDDGKTFDTGNVEPGESSKALKFEKAGEFKYHCLVHGKTMSGIIVVKAAAK